MITLENILETVRLWKFEADNHHNDGWVMQGYRDKLRQVKDELDKFYFRPAELLGYDVELLGFDQDLAEDKPL